MPLRVVLQFLPYWIREPLLIVGGLFFTGVCFHWYVVKADWRMAVLSVVFLGISIARASILRRDWRARPRADLAG
ncbi:hypothetical protein OG413_42410 [Streptomyces sp. NBC_01433]|uniref:hypothetical protein n=1 Tax=Streptomyces sp. NBC_01433 TaxID=2903864 RepID=UPI00224F9BB9|nr:hypothetical protein [Streptomyces sp. NBC_01433]MCX4681860.1 hypothetical protein [Streptomyces sp. NBC_01433]